jgi:prepilin-type N-terminal cleavage/methylation domain-containing protein
MLRTALNWTKQMLVLTLAGILPLDLLNSFSAWLGQNDEIEDTNPVISARRHPIRVSAMNPPTPERILKHPYLIMATGKTKGFSLVELMVVIAIIGILCAGTGLGSVILGKGCGVSGQGGSVQVDATQQANTYAAGMGYQDPHVQCVTWDSDKDGYVSCTVAFTQPNGTIGKDTIECAAGMNLKGMMNEGCRTPKAQIPSAL